MKPQQIALLTMICLLFTLPAVQAKEIVGYAEKTRIYPGGLEIRTRIDTGASLASLHCDCITPIKRGGEDWVSFTVTNYAGDKIRLEKKIQRIATIKRHYGETQERYVIELGICLGSIYRTAEVTLIDRAGLTYPMLVGRDFMGKDFLVDTAEKFINDPHCDVPGMK